MKKLWTLSAILLAWVLLAGCWNKEEVTIEEEVIENDYHPVLVARTAQDLELEDIDQLNTLSSAFLWNVEIEQLDWTNVVLIKAWNELTEDAINETIETLEENDKITGVVRVVNDEYEEFFSSYDNW
jgi:PBP1b-binding outer membrane lipoprotein LpoB